MENLIILKRLWIMNLQGKGLWRFIKPASRKDSNVINPFVHLCVYLRDPSWLNFFYHKNTKDFTKEHKGNQEEIIISLNSGWLAMIHSENY